ncbi:MAG: hypothetical protein E7273_06015 [Pseudobutyrivibrio ruminis]|nr:hypothetical protein [Pseudobutyrivibrio ruminis]
MKEIGGYLEFENLYGESYHPKAIALNCGRSCLAYLIETKKIKKLYLPYYLCNSIRKCCERYGVSYDYYHIDKSFKPIIDNLDSDEYILIVNYWGVLKPDYIKELKQRFRNIIVDNTQAFFEQPVGGVDTFYVARKFFGVPDGAYLYTDARIKRELIREKGLNGMTHILGRYECTADDYFKEYHKSEARFNGIEIRLCSKITENLLRAVDYDKVRNIRNNNFNILAEQLNNNNLLKVGNTNGAYMYPLFVEDGEKIKKSLIRKKIYVPTLWEEVYEICDKTDIEYQFTKNIVLLPVDQRYTTEDMRYIAQIINKVLG